MTIKDPKELFVRLLSNVRNCEEKSTDLLQEMSQAVQDPDIKEALESRVFLKSQTLSTLDRCFKLIGEKPVSVADEKMQQMVAEFLLHCNSLTIGARNMLYHLRLMRNAPHPHFGTAHRKELKVQPQFRTRMTRIALIFTDMRFFYDVNFQIYDAARHESTSINYILPLEGV